MTSGIESAPLSIRAELNTSATDESDFTCITRLCARGFSSGLGILV
jgi:hypothetical protein